jgi:COP9 signalosome complex subunit 5
MVMHARSGGSLEVMGLMQGSIAGDTFIVTDAFRLPVEGTETRVNAQDEANEYMVKFLERARENGQMENAVGWYHSHPGYGCWLSGIDVTTQMTQQMYQDPFVAVVIDPDRTISAGKVEIGGFRTYPENYKPEGNIDSEGFQTIPMGKIEDFGAHSNRYYSLEVSHFKSTLDTQLLSALWNKYWVSTLSSSPLLTNRDYGTKQIQDLASKIQDANSTPSIRAGGGMGGKKEGSGKIDKIVKAACKIEAEEKAGLMAANVKERIFGVKVPATVELQSS